MTKGEKLRLITDILVHFPWIYSIFRTLKTLFSREVTKFHVNKGILVHLIKLKGPENRFAIFHLDQVYLAVQA